MKVLVWTLVGICLTQTVRLEAWAEVVESRAQYAASRVRRFARWLHHPAIDPQAWYGPLILSLFANWSRQERVYVALDITALTPFMPRPDPIREVLAHFQPLFTAPTWRKMMVLLTGTMLAHGPRTVAAALRHTGNEM